MYAISMCSGVVVTCNQSYHQHTHILTPHTHSPPHLPPHCPTHPIPRPPHPTTQELNTTVSKFGTRLTLGDMSIEDVERWVDSKKAMVGAKLFMNQLRARRTGSVVCGLGRGCIVCFVVVVFCGGCLWWLCAHTMHSPPKCTPHTGFVASEENVQDLGLLSFHPDLVNFITSGPVFDYEAHLQQSAENALQTLLTATDGMK